MKVSPGSSRKALLGFLPLMILLVGQLGFRATDTILQASAEAAPQEHWEKVQWQDAHFLSPRGWKQRAENNGQLTFLPDNSVDSDKAWITLSSVPNEDFGLRGTLERYVREDIGDAKTVVVSNIRETHLGSGYDGLAQRVTTKNERGELVYKWYFLMEVGGQNKMLRFTAESPERQTRYQKDFNRFLNNLSFDAAPTYQGPVIDPANYYEGRQIASREDSSRG